MPRIYYLFPVLFLVPFTHDNVSLKVCFRVKQKIWKKPVNHIASFTFPVNTSEQVPVGWSRPYFAFHAPSTFSFPLPPFHHVANSTCCRQGLPYCSDSGRRLIIVMKSSSYFFLGFIAMDLEWIPLLTWADPWCGCTGPARWRTGSGWKRLNTSRRTPPTCRRTGPRRSSSLEIDSRKTKHNIFNLEICFENWFKLLIWDRK